MDKDVTFTFEIKMKARWGLHFIAFLNRLCKNGVMGHSEVVAFYSDGDGDFRPKVNLLKVENFDKCIEEIENCELPEPRRVKMHKEIIDIFDAG